MSEKSETRIALEARAEKLGITFSHNIGDEKLAKRVAKAEAEHSAPANDEASDAPADDQQDQGDGDETSLGEITSDTSAPETNEASDADQAGGDQDDAPDLTNGGEGDTGQVNAPADPEPTEIPMVTVIGPKTGRWRIGRQFFRRPVTEIPLANLSVDELAELEADPKLKVSVPKLD